MIDKTYQPNDVEGRIYAEWEQAGAFRAGRPERAEAAPYSIVIPPPNVTGSLHMGHALNNTLQDILARFERMRGKDVLWQPGTDHAGIATQMVVERQLMERQEPSRREMGRAKFLERVWAWKAESGGIITRQLKRLGASCDWSRERFTMDEGLSRAVLQGFRRALQRGPDLQGQAAGQLGPEAAHRDLRPGGAAGRGEGAPLAHQISDRGLGRIHHRRHHAARDHAGRRRGRGASGQREAEAPDRQDGDPAVGRPQVFPIVGDDYADPEKGTGAVKITPAHDFNDFEVGKRHDLPQVNVLDIEGKLTLNDNEAFTAGVPKSTELAETFNFTASIVSKRARSSSSVWKTKA